MKRFLTLLLAAAMVLSFAACGDNGTTIRNEKEEDNVKKDPIAAQYLQDLAVKTADYPVLPAMPNESELDEALLKRTVKKITVGHTGEFTVYFIGDIALTNTPKHMEDENAS